MLRVKAVTNPSTQETWIEINLVETAKMSLMMKKTLAHPGAKVAKTVFIVELSPWMFLAKKAI